MTSSTVIGNLTASKLGEDDQMLSIDDDDTHLARSLRAVWDPVRRAALRDHPWNFAMARTGLSAEALKTVPYPWAYSFPLPAACVRLIEVLNLTSTTDYQVEGQAILCNSAGPVYIRYLQDVAETALWDDLFVEAFSWRLAYTVADRITGDRGRKSDCWQGYTNALSQAKRVDARENPPVDFEMTSWETARYGGGA